MDFAALLRQLESAPNSTYRYPDAAAQIEAKLPPTKREAERLLWHDALSRAFGAEHPIAGVALDAGCGDGAYLLELSERFEHVGAGDPDARRVARARERCPGVPVFALGLEEALAGVEGVLRLAQSMQVLGHLSCEGAQRAMGRLARSLSPDGVLLLAVPYTNVFADEFRVSELGVPESRRVPREEYDELASRPRPGALPVRHLSMLSLTALLDGAGLRAEWSSPYGWLNYELADLLVLARAGR